MRRTRLWRCDRCRVLYSRRKSQRGKQPCYRCGYPMVAATKWPSVAWLQSRRKRKEREKQARLKDRKRWSRPRATGRRRFKPSSKSKRIWRRVARATTPSAIRYASQDFVDALCLDLHPVEDRTPPKVHYKSAPPSGTLGIYRRGVDGHSIVIWKRPAEEMKATLLHEALHLIDGVACLPDDHGAHGPAWTPRLHQFKLDLGAAGRKYIDGERSTA